MAAKFFFKKSNDLESPSEKSLILDSTNERSNAAFDDSNILESTDDVINETNEFLSDDDDIPLVQLRKHWVGIKGLVFTKMVNLQLILCVLSD